jgi:P-type Cu2+ transporter
VYISRPGVGGIVELVSMARRTFALVRRSFGISLFYNVVAGVLALMGLMHPLLAAIIMPISSATTISTAVWSVRRARREVGSSDRSAESKCPALPSAAV